MDKAKLLAILDECIDQEKLAKLLAKEIVMPALAEAAAKTPNKLDDAAVALIDGAVEKAVE